MSANDGVTCTEDEDEVPDLPSFRAGSKRRDSVAVSPRRRTSVAVTTGRRSSVALQRPQTGGRWSGMMGKLDRTRRRSGFGSKSSSGNETPPPSTRKHASPEDKSRRLSVAQDTIKEIAQSFEKTKEENEEIRKQYQRLQERSASTMTQMERTQKLLNRIKAESAKKSSEMDRLQQEFSSLGDRIRALENKAMEVEKLEISVETLKKNLDNTQQEVREREREVRQLQRTLEAKEKELTTSQGQVTILEKINRDLKLQVREELIKNTQLEMRIEDTDRLKETLVDRQRDIQDLNKVVEEKTMLALHARKCLREEKDKCKKLQDKNHDMDSMKEEVEIVTSENQTLKRLLAAKDVILQQRSQTVNSLKSMIRDHVTPEVYKDILRSLSEATDINPGSSTPRTPRGRGHDRKKAKVSEDQKSNSRTDMNGSRAYNGGSQLFKTILSEDETGSDDNKELQTDNRHKSTVVRSRAYADSFSDFRSNSPSQSDVMSINSYSTYNGSQSDKWATRTDRYKIRRTQSMRVTTVSGSRSTMTSSSIDHLDSWSKHESKTHATENGTSEKTVHTDSRLTQHVKAGDRIVVDISKKKGSSKDLQTGLVKYVGHLEGDKNTYRVFVGLKLDGPDGDTDGLIRGKRYFRVSPCHGMFVRIHKVLSVFNKQTGTYDKMEDLLVKTRDRTTIPQPVR